MRTLVGLLCAVTLAVFAQSDRGTITGTISDPAGAVVANAPVEAKNVQTGATFQAGSSATGNYTLAQLPTGTYELSVTVPGFKKFVRQNVTVPVAATLRIDISLEVGANTESVTVTEAAPLLKTESGELSHNVATDRMNNLPVLGTGAAAGTAGIRNPYSVMQLLPGTDYRPDSSVRVNGLPSNTQALRIEGQDTTNGLINTQSMTQPSVDAIQEFAIQTSNFAAEFGQAGGGVFNATMKSGSNRLHGSAYEYFANEALNAGTPFTDNGKGSLLRPRTRRNDYGFTVGGPVLLPKIYDGHDKSFFFFNFEQFRETRIINNTSTTVPTAAYRLGNFASALTGRNLCQAPNTNCDPLGRPIMENQIYNPKTQRVAPNGQTVRDPYPGNIVPATDWDPVSAKIQTLFPNPTNPNALINNYLPTYTNPRLTYIPSVKVDHNLSPTRKVSGYWSRTYTQSPNNNTMPFPLNGVPQSVTAHTIRLNYDQSVTPTALLHIGVGLLHNYLNQNTGRYDVVNQLGLRGTYTDLFPSLQGMSAALGGMANVGPGTNAKITNTKPTANTSLTWVRNNHTYKFGGEMILEGYVAANETYANAWIVFSQTESGLPSTNGQSLAGGNPGFNYASFLLGGVNNGFIGIPSKSRMGSHAFSGFVQDTWKVTRKLTLDYGLRYDFQSYLKEQYGRYVVFSASTPNPTAGGRLGAVAGEGYGGGRCDCQLAHNYPYAFGPRLAAAYQITPKTVIRAGIGVSYYKTNDNGFVSYSTGSQKVYFAPVFGDPAYNLRDGLPYRITWPDFNPGQLPLPGTTNGPSQQLDPNAGRPPRILQWSVNLQRELTRNTVVEAAYVANRGVYWNSAQLISHNALTQQILDRYGLDLHRSADQALLNGPINSSAAVTRGFSGLPYPGFPTSASVGQALRPYPQFGHLNNFHWAPLGKSWYDSLQVKLTQRLSRGLDVQSSFTWSKNQSLGGESGIGTIGPILAATNDVFNRDINKTFSGFDQPFLFVFSGNYTTPVTRWNKALSWVARDWSIGAVLRYGSGFPILSPRASNGLTEALFRQNGVTGNAGGTFMNRVPGEPLFTVDMNCHCYDPSRTFVLNPKAWTNPLPGDFGTAAPYYGDYRYQRRPVESMSLARNFVFGAERRYNLQIRGEFTNIFNRTQPNNPTSTNALATQSRNNTTGQTSAGFGFINVGTVMSDPRQGTLVARFQF